MQQFCTLEEAWNGGFASDTYYKNNMKKISENFTDISANKKILRMSCHDIITHVLKWKK